MTAVLHLIDKPFPPDIRLEKEARALAVAGYEVHVLCRRAAGAAGTGHDAQRRGAAAACAGAFHLHELPARRRAPLMGGRDLRYLVTFVDGAWLEEIERLAAALRPALLHVHDLPLAPTALLAARRLSVPVVVDYRENWPAALRVWRSASPGRGIARLRSRAVALVHECGPRYRRAEISVARRAEQVLVVTEENRDRLIAAGVPAARVTVVRNAVDPAEISGEAAGFEPPRSPFLIVYAGDLARFRGVQDVIAAMPEVLAHEPEAMFLVMGDGVARAELVAESRRRGVEHAVRFTGWLPGGAVGAAMKAAAVGVVPHRRNEHTESTMPNKIYQYLWSGLPVVTSDAAPLARVVLSAGCGLVARSGDPESYARVLVSLLDREERTRLAARAREAARTWDDEARTLLEIYRRLARDV